MYVEENYAYHMHFAKPGFTYRVILNVSSDEVIIDSNMSWMETVRFPEYYGITQQVR